MADNPLPPLRVQSQYNDNIDARLRAIIEQAAAYTQFQVELRSGFRPGDSRQHGKKNAVDINLIDPSTGQVLPNYQDGRNFREYEAFAQAARAIQMANYPELEQDFRWGGYFGSKSGPKGYGAMDLMHFDLAGDKIGMGQGSWENGLSKTMKTAYNIPDTASVGMGQNARSKTYVSQLTPGGYQPKPPEPATQTASLATQRQGPQTAAQVLAGIDGANAPTGQPAATPTAYASDPGAAVNPNIPRPMPLPRDRMPAPVAQPPINVAEVYAGTPMQAPGQAPASVAQTQLPPSEIYKGTPLRPPGEVVPQEMQTAEQIYKGFPLQDASQQPAEIVTASTQAPVATKPAEVIGAMREVNKGTPASDYPTIQPTPTEGVIVAQDMEAPTPATPSSALQAARARLEAERAKKTAPKNEPGAARPEGPAAGMPAAKKDFAVIDHREEGVWQDPLKLPDTNFVRPAGPPGSMPAAKEKEKAPAPATQSAALKEKRSGNALEAPTPRVQSFSLEAKRNGEPPPALGMPSIAEINAQAPGNSLMGRLASKHNTKTLVRAYERALGQAQAALNWMRPGANLITVYGGSTANGSALSGAPSNSNATYYQTRNGPVALSSASQSNVEKYGSATSGPAWDMITGNN